MKKSTYAEIRKNSSLNTIYSLIVALFLVIWAGYMTLYVAQTDFSKLKPGVLADQMDRIAGMQKKACLDISEVKSLADEISSKSDIK